MYEWSLFINVYVILRVYSVCVCMCMCVCVGVVVAPVPCDDVDQLICVN